MGSRRPIALASTDSPFHITVGTPEPQDQHRDPAAALAVSPIEKQLSPKRWSATPHSSDVVDYRRLSRQRAAPRADAQRAPSSAAKPNGTTPQQSLSKEETAQHLLEQLRLQLALLHLQVCHCPPAGDRANAEHTLAAAAAMHA